MRKTPRGGESCSQREPNLPRSKQNDGTSLSEVDQAGCNITPGVGINSMDCERSSLRNNFPWTLSKATFISVCGDSKEENLDDDISPDTNERAKHYKLNMKVTTEVKRRNDPTFEYQTVHKHVGSVSGA